MFLALLKVGEPYSYDFGPNNAVIKRQYDDQTSQFINAGTDYWTNDKVKEQHFLKISYLFLE